MTMPPSGSGRSCTRYCLPRAAYRASAVRALFRPEVIRLVEVDGIDLLAGHELGYLDLLRRFLLQRLQFLGGEGDVAILGELVSLHHLIALHHHVVVARADVLLLEAPAAFGVEQVEGDGRRRLCGRVQVDRDGHQTEGNGALGNGPSAHAPDDNLQNEMPKFLDEYRRKRSPDR